MSLIPWQHCGFWGRSTVTASSQRALPTPQPVACPGLLWHLGTGKLSTKKRGRSFLALESFDLSTTSTRPAPSILCEASSVLCEQPTDKRSSRIFLLPTIPSSQNGWSLPPRARAVFDPSLARLPTPRCLRGSRERIVD